MYQRTRRGRRPRRPAEQLDSGRGIDNHPVGLLPTLPCEGGDGDARLDARRHRCYEAKRSVIRTACGGRVVRTGIARTVTRAHAFLPPLCKGRWIGAAETEGLYPHHPRRR